MINDPALLIDKSYLLMLGAYLIGAIPFSWLIGRLNSVDILQAGSGNSGAYNVRRLLGWRWGLIALIVDVLKGVIPVWLARNLNSEIQIQYLVAFAAIFGHCYSIFLKILGHRWTGGRGVATSLGAIIGVTHPVVPISMVLVFLTILAVSRLFSLSVLAAWLWFSLMQVGLFWKGVIDWTGVAFAAITLILVYLRHAGHIAKLLTGEEEIFQLGRSNISSASDVKVSKVISQLKLDPGYTFNDLITVVEQLIGCPIDFVPRPMPHGYTGFCLIGETITILFDERVSSVHQMQIKLHEVAHLLLRHDPPHPEEEEREIIEKLLASQADYMSVEKVLMRHSYKRDQDKEAELLAQRLLEDIRFDPPIDNDPLEKIQLN